MWWEAVSSIPKGNGIAVVKKIVMGLAILMAVTAGGSFLTVKAMPARELARDASLSRLAGGKTFPALCDATGDFRPDPAWVRQSFENDHCWAPPMPARLDGFRASRNQIVAGMAAVKRYGAQSDLYERCIRDYVATRQVQARKDGKRMDTVLFILENHRLTADLRNRKKAADQITTAINDFNQYGSDCPA
jgi:hypothetical protein